MSAKDRRPRVRKLARARERERESGQANIMYFYSEALRLVGGSTSYDGRVEIYSNYQWGTVCDDGWDLNDAAVVCRQLFGTSAYQAPQSAHFGQGSGPIWLDDVQCSGSESYLVQCPSRGLGSHNCGHQEDASVVCYGQLTAF